MTMEKKLYMAPVVEFEKMESALPLCLSGVSGDGDLVDADYGGVDVGGILDPESKMRPDLGEELNMIFW